MESECKLSFTCLTCLIDRSMHLFLNESIIGITRSLQCHFELRWFLVHVPYSIFIVKLLNMTYFFLCHQKMHFLILRKSFKCCIHSYEVKSYLTVIISRSCHMQCVVVVLLNCLTSGAYCGRFVPPFDPIGKFISCTVIMSVLYCLSKFIGMII